MTTKFLRCIEIAEGSGIESFQASGLFEHTFNISVELRGSKKSLKTCLTDLKYIGTSSSRCF